MRALALLALLAAIVAGCGANDPVAVEEISAASQRTAEAGSSRIEAIGGTGDERFTITGIADYERDRSRLVISGRNEGQPLEAELVLLGNRLYLPSDSFGASGTKGKKWISFILPETERYESLDSLVVPFPFVDPAALLDTFERVGGEPERLGSEDIRGVPADGYRVELDLAKLVAEVPERHRGALEAALERREVTTLPVEVWIDDANRARRIVLEIEGDEARFDFFDFGIDVDVRAPSPDEVLDSGDILGTTSVEAEGSGAGPATTMEEDG